MAMSNFKKKALQEMNIRFVWAVLLISIVFGMLDYAVLFLAKLFDKNISSGSIAVFFAGGSLSEVINSFSFLDLAHVMLFIFWSLLMLVILSKWIFRQIIARRK